MQRLAHAHEDHIAQALTLSGEKAPRQMHLSQDFTSAQMPHKAHLAGGAKHATHGAAHLGAHADGVALGIGHQHGFNFLAVLKG